MTTPAQLNGRAGDTRLADELGAALVELSMLLRRAILPPQTSLTEACSVTQPTMSGCISGMERLGWVRRDSGGADRRVVSVCLTEDGMKVLRDLEEARTCVLLADLESLPDADRAALAAAMPALRRIIAHEQQEKKAVTS